MLRCSLILQLYTFFLLSSLDLIRWENLVHVLSVKMTACVHSLSPLGWIETSFSAIKPRSEKIWALVVLLVPSPLRAQSAWPSGSWSSPLIAQCSWEPSFWRSRTPLVVPNFFKLRIMEPTKPLDTFSAAKLFLDSSCDLCRTTILSLAVPLFC